MPSGEPQGSPGRVSIHRAAAGPGAGRMVWGGQFNAEVPGLSGPLCQHPPDGLWALREHQQRQGGSVGLEAIPVTSPLTCCAFQLVPQPQRTVLPGSWSTWCAVVGTGWPQLEQQQLWSVSPWGLAAEAPQAVLHALHHVT